VRSGPGGLPRLIPAGTRLDPGLGDHLARLGPPAYRGRAGTLIAEVEAAGLTGRGGAAFPVHRKLTAVASAARRAVVVGNAAEGEPASFKDRSLLWLAPHLVLDGLQLAAEAVGAGRVCLYVPPDQTLSGQLAAGLAQRWAAGIDRASVELITAPDRFLAGEESALVSRINGGPARPQFKQPPVFERGVDGLPTLVPNVETLAHLALIARCGARWFRSAGTPAEPGSMLCTVHRADGGRYVIEAAIGAPLVSLLGLAQNSPGPLATRAQAARAARTQAAGVQAAGVQAAGVQAAGVQAAGVQAILCGGFHGAWLDPADAARLSLSNASLRPAGAFTGAGILAELPTGRCGLAETARVAHYLALESAGQCGPCFNGLPRVAAALAELAGRRPADQTLTDIRRWAGLLEGRGACHHPDGFVRFVRSALTVFRAEIGRHARGRCTAMDRRPFLPVPAPAATEADWS
jgi:NADH:ubiquinone oxidoreductase subunit F (NADH-binding)